MALAFESFDFTAQRPVKPKSPGLMGHVADTAMQFGQGVMQGGQMLADAFGAGNAVSGAFKGGADWLASNFSDELKWEQMAAAEDMAAAQLSGSTWEEVKAAARSVKADPVGFLVNAAGTSIPTIAAALLPGGQAGALGRLAMLGRSATVGAAQGAGSVKGSIYEDVKQRWEKAGASEEEAKSRASAAQEYLGSNAGQVALGAAIGAVAGSTGFEGGLAAKSAAKRGLMGVDDSASRVPRIVRDTFKEAGPEAIQGGQEQLAANLAAQNEGFAQDTWGGVAGGMTLEGMAGGIVGAAGSPFTRRPAESLPSVDEEKPKAPLAAIGSAPNVDQAVDRFVKAVDAPIAPQALTASDEAAALDALDAIAAGDERSVKFGSVPRPTSRLNLPAEQTELGAEIPFGDRVIILREQIADPDLRAELGREAFEQVHYYASIADRTDINLPMKTRENMLALAESIVDRVRFKPMQGPGQTQPAAALPEPTRLIGLDTRPTGVMRVDSAGSVAPETQADAIETRNLADRAAARRDGLMASVPRGAEPAVQPKKTPDVARAQRSTLVEPVDIDPNAPNAVAQYVESKRQTNTPAARAFVQAFEAGHISSDDVLALMVPSAQPSADERLAAAAAQAPKPQDGMLLTADGFPYGTKSGAVVRAKREGLAPESVVEVQGGYAVRPKEMPSVEQSDVAAPAAELAGAADGQGVDAGGGVGAVRPVPAGERWMVRAADAPAAGREQGPAVADGGMADEAMSPAPAMGGQAPTAEVDAQAVPSPQTAPSPQAEPSPQADQSAPTAQTEQTEQAAEKDRKAEVERDQDQGALAAEGAADAKPADAEAKPTLTRKPLRERVDAMKPSPEVKALQQQLDILTKLRGCLAS